MALGSAGGLPTVLSAFTWYGGSDEPIARAMMGRMRLNSLFRNRLYLGQSLGSDRLPWFLLPLRCFCFLLLVFQFLAPVQIGSRIPSEQEERERDTQPYHRVMMPVLGG